MKERPSPTFGPISCIGSKSVWMSAHPGASITWLINAHGVWRAHPQVLCISEVRNFVCYTLPKVNTKQLCVDKHGSRGTHHEVNYAYINGATQSVVCRQDLTSKPLVDPTYVLLIQLFASSRIHGYQVVVNSKGRSFMVKCESIQKSTHPPLWWTCKVFCPWVLSWDYCTFSYQKWN